MLLVCLAGCLGERQGQLSEQRGALPSELASQSTGLPSQQELALHKNTLGKYTEVDKTEEAPLVVTTTHPRDAKSNTSTVKEELAVSL